jgi:hypothetical protein
VGVKNVVLSGHFLGGLKEIMRNFKKYRAPVEIPDSKLANENSDA